MKSFSSAQQLCDSFKMYLKVFKTVKQAINSQIRLLSTYFDPVFEDSSFDSRGNVNHQFIIPLLYYLTGFLYGVFGLNPHFHFSDVFSLEFYRTNGYIYYHQFLLQKSWRQSDILFLLNCAFTFLCYLLAALTPPIARKFRINQTVALKQNCSHSSLELAKIFQFRNRFCTFIRVLSTCYFLYLITFTIKHVFQFGRFTLDVRNILFWFVYEPVMICYHIFGKVSFEFFFNKLLKNTSRSSKLTTAAIRHPQRAVPQCTAAVAAGGVFTVALESEGKIY